MKLLLSNEAQEQIANKHYAEYEGHNGYSVAEDAAQAQLNHIFNLDIKTTVKLIEKLRKRLDKLLEREMAK